MLPPLSRFLRGLRSPRHAVFLYALLILLPAGVFGGLLWEQLRADQRQTLETVPREVRDAANRLGIEARRRIRDLLGAEAQRPFTEYADYEWVPSSASQATSPLRFSRRPEGIDGWFQFDYAEGLEAQLQLFLGSNPAPPASTLERYRAWLQTQAVEHLQFSYNSRDLIGWDTLLQSDAYWDQSSSLLTPDLGSTAYFTHRASGMNCDPEEMEAFIAGLGGSTHQVLQTTSLHLIPGPFGHPTILALRDIRIKRMPRTFARSIPTCMEPLFSNQHWIQGFWLDGDWLLEGMPRQVGNTVLSDRQLLFSGQNQPDPDQSWSQAQVELLENVDFERDVFGPGFGRMRVAVNIGE
ncbi:MAG: hypothetical protein KDB61_13710, partial [Planctomycetes bacterium]|nr:hypothetical protein [Planctomycetota bacterium]